ncbi:MAG TPA: DNA topoisomerase I [Thermoplasmata archaeon]|nr:DNA topoisomerase I [Thermoplasmata archaeon]
MEENSLVLCEKNLAARRIAQILSDGKMKTSYLAKIPFYEFEKKGHLWRVMGLRGHLLRLDYPSRYTQWRSTPLKELIWAEPSKKVEERSIANAIETFLKQSDKLIIATDFDREGELIGVESFSWLEKPLDIPIKRARFSSLTAAEISYAFRNFVGVDFNLAKAAEAREHIDLAWGAVLTRFVSLAANRYGRNFLSVGRVQSPALALVVDREKEIANFKPIPYWEITVEVKDGVPLSLFHTRQPFWEESRAKETYDKVKDAKEGVVKKVDKKEIFERAPVPFNTTEFLRAASSLGIGVSTSMQIAESLYRKGLISYPRTDNQVYPRSLNLRLVANKLKNSKLSSEAEAVLENPRSSPTEGKFAHDHPPIYPVDVEKGKLNDREEKIYELIARRFLATLSKDALCESIDMEIEVNGEKFKTNGYRVIAPNWRNVYPLGARKEKTIPSLEPGQKVKITKTNLKQNKTKPTKRFTQASLLSKMEQLGLGTKSTRHEIIKKLYDRNFIEGLRIKPSTTAEAIIEVLQKHAPRITLPSMTSHLEQQMDSIAKGEIRIEDVIDDSREVLSKEFETLEANQKSIGEEIIKALREQESVGRCPECGFPMLIRVSRKGEKFIGCSNYPKCRNTYSLPRYGKVISTHNSCKRCSAPIVKVVRKRKVYEICVNPRCETNKK